MENIIKIMKIMSKIVAILTKKLAFIAIKLYHGVTELMKYKFRKKIRLHFYAI